MTTVLAIALSLVFLPLGQAKLAAAPVMRRAAARFGLRPASPALSARWRWPASPVC